MLRHFVATVLLLGAGGALAQEPCPSSAQLLQRLGELGAPVERLKQVAVTRGAQGAAVTAQRDDGAALDRPLGEDGDCGALTDAAAVVVLAWLTRLDGPEAPVVPAPRPVPNVVAEPPAPPPPAPVQLAAGAGASLWYGDSATWGAEGYLALASRGWRLQPQLVIFGQGERSAPVASGRVFWNRVSIVPGTGLIFGSAGLLLRIELGLATGVLMVGGRGFQTNQTSLSADLGARVGLRVSYGGWAVRPYLAAGAVFWAVGHRLDVVPVGPVTTLPGADVQLTLGIELGR
ncbi:MAG: hypothetical protein QM723_34000 [Myxococcaceae bacterium]